MIKLNNGQLMPEIFAGTNYMEYSGLKEMVKTAILNGCRGFDTSPNYLDTELFLGKIIQELNKELDINISDLFLQTKLEWKDMQHGENGIIKAFKKSKKNLGEKIDSYLIHWPHPDLWLPAYKSLEKLYNDGLIKSIGVCNLRERHFLELTSVCTVMPNIIQIETHPLRVAENTILLFKNNNISVQAYSPICKMIAPIKENKILNELSVQYEKTIAQIILRWDIQRGVIPIFKSATPFRIQENLQINDFALTENDMEKINSIDEDYKFVVESWSCPGF